MITINNRITLLIYSTLIGVFISACGGGNISVADGGINGTGISMGRITNFGSIFVNGVRFDVDNADFIRDGEPASGQDDYSVGEFVVIKGTIESSGTTGTADEVTFTNEIEGAITLLSSDGLSLEVLGQTVVTNSLTVLIGIDSLTNLALGNIVEVSGVKDSNGNILATSIKFKASSFISGSSENELKGLVASLDTTSKTFMINNITIDYANAIFEDFGSQPLLNNLYVEVESDSMIIGNILQADKIELEDENSELTEGYEAEIEGTITRFNSASDFDVNGFTVTTNLETEYSDGTLNDLVEGALVEVEGITNSAGVLVAESIEFEDEESELDEHEGFIDSIDLSANQVIVSGKTIIIVATTIMRDESDLKVSPLTLSDLAVTDKVKVVGISQVNGDIVANKFERKEVQE